MKSRFASPERGIFCVLLVTLLCGCASGPPGTGHPGTRFVFYSKETPAGARMVSREAEQFLEDVADYLRLEVPPGHLLKIYHYPNRLSLWRHLRREVPSLQWRRGVCYETSEAYTIALRGNPGGGRFQETLRHELTHYLIATHFCDFPPWIDEGLAQVMAEGPPFPRLERERVETVQREARSVRERGCVDLLHVPPGERLSQSQYRTARAVTYYLLTRPSRSTTNDLNRFLESTRPGVPLERIFSESWGVTIEEACEGMAAWARSGIEGQK